MNGWDCYFFWTGGPMRKWIYTHMKRLLGITVNYDRSRV